MKSKKQKRQPYKRKSNELQTALGETMGLGIGSMAGMSAVGAINAQIPGGAGNKTAGIIGASTNLLNIGQLGKNSKTIMKMFK